MGSVIEKNRGRQSRATVPLKGYLPSFNHPWFESALSETPQFRHQTCLRHQQCLRHRADGLIIYLTALALSPTALVQHQRCLRHC